MSMSVVTMSAPTVSRMALTGAQTPLPERVFSSTSSMSVQPDTLTVMTPTSRNRKDVAKPQLPRTVFIFWTAIVAKFVMPPPYWRTHAAAGVS